MAVAQTVTGQVGFNASATQTATTGQVNAAGQTLTELISQVYQYKNAQGVQYGVDQLFAKQYTLASTTVTIHLETATSSDPFGNTLAMLRYRDIFIQVISATLGYDLAYYSSASDGVAWLPTLSAFAGGLKVRAGGMDWKSDPLSFGASQGNYVTATTDGITLDSSIAAQTIIFNVVVVGNSQA